jgi:hypothetical protein
VAQNSDIRKIEQALALIRNNRDRAVVNLKMVVNRVRDGYASAFPDDPCRSPSPEGVVPIPYPNTGIAGDTSKGTKKVKINVIKSAALKDDSNLKVSESDELGTKTSELADLIQSRNKRAPLKERDKATWKITLMMYQDQAATIVKSLDRYVEEVENLLEESRQELRFGIKQ